METTSRTTADRFLLPTSVTPSHYALVLTPNLQTFEFAGTVDIDVTVNNEDVLKVELHCHEIDINKACFSGADGAVLNMCSVAYNFELTTVTLSFPSALPAGTGKLHIEYRGILNDQMAGFYRSKYADVEGNDQYMAATQFEALDARRAFPCWDEPAMKATFAVTLIVQQDLQALSNMPELSCTHMSNGKKKVVFDVTPVMSTYLLAFAVGVWDVICDKTRHGVNVNVFSPPGRGEQGRFALDVATKCLDFYDDFFQVPYPLPKLDMLVITEFAAGAMENWGLVTYRENALLIKDAATAEVSHKQRVAMVVCHELAHQWFGNLVTMRWWCDLWLNEGFAAFMQHFATDFIFPEWKIWEQYTIDTVGVALKLDGLRSSHPVMVPIYHAKEVEQVFDAISYNKGSTIVRMAQAVLGTEKFREGLQLYCKRHAYTNTETSDLWQAWSDVSGIDMPTLMKSWTMQMGYPFLSVEDETWSDSGVKMKLKQQWFLNDGAGLTREESEITWRIPLLVATSGGGRNESASDNKGGVMNADNIAGTTYFERYVELPQRSDGGVPWIKMNSNQSTLLRVSHSEKMITNLTTAILRGEVSAIDRAALVDDQFFLGMTGRAPLDLFANCLPAYQGESNITVWKALAPTLTQLLGAIESVSSPNSEVVVTYKSFAKGLVLRGLELVGWDTKDGEDERFKLMRGTIFSLVEAFCADEPSILAEARRRFAESLACEGEASSSISSDIKASLYRIVLSNGGEPEFNQVLETYNNTNEDAIRKWALTTLGSASTRELKLRVMDWAVSTAVKLQDIYQPMMSVAGSGALGREVAWSYFKENFENIKDKVAKANIWTMQGIIVACTSKFCTHDSANEIEAFFNEHPVAGVDKRIAQIVERTRANAGLSDKVQKSSLMSPEFWSTLGK